MRFLDCSPSTYYPQPLFPITSHSFAQWQQAGQGQGECRATALQLIRECMRLEAPILDLSSLGLTSLPDDLPSHVVYLDVSNNRLTSLPESLPERLCTLVANDNALTHLPAKLPCGILEVYVQNNHLTQLPIQLAQIAYGTVDVINNPLPIEEYHRFLLMSKRGEYTGPQIDFSTELKIEHNVTHATIPSLLNAIVYKNCRGHKRKFEE